MKQTQSFVKPHIADRVIADDNAEQRAVGATIVARQLDNSVTFARCFWIAAVLGGGAALWFRSWTPLVVAAVLLSALYFKLFVLMSREVMRHGELPEYQAAYKRLYYSDLTFKRQVDDLLAAKKKKSPSPP